LCALQFRTIAIPTTQRKYPSRGYTWSYINAIQLKGIISRTTYRKVAVVRGVLSTSRKTLVRKKIGLTKPLIAIETFSIGESPKKLPRLCR